MSDRKSYVAIVGPTACGKSALAMAIARRLDGEIISCDSVQLYCGFDIGSAKPTSEERAEIGHHMIDVLQWHEQYNASTYADAATKAISDTISRRKLPIVVGGTGLYLRALWGEDWHELPKDEMLRKSLESLTNEELHQRLIVVDPERSNKIHCNDRFRLLRAVELITLLNGPVSRRLTEDKSHKQHVFTIKIKPQRPQILKKISRRTRQMIAQGFQKEVEGLLAKGVSLDCKPMMSIGYKQVSMLLKHELAQIDLAREIDIATAQYAKRQSTWFQKVEADCLIEDENRALGEDFEKLVETVRSNFQL